MIGGAYSHIVKRLMGVAAQRLCVLVKTLEVGEKFGLRGKAVDNADRVVDIKGCS